MENNPIPFLFEAACNRLDRVIRRLTTALTICVTLVFLSNALWLWAWVQYDYTSETTETTYTQDGQGTNIIGDHNEVANGTEQEDSDEEAHEDPEEFEGDQET